MSQRHQFRTTARVPGGSKGSLALVGVETGRLGAQGDASRQADSELANEFASFSIEQLKQKYAELNDAINEHSQVFVAAAANASVHWDALLPFLRRMQALLSQRGDHRVREAELPTWTAWVEAFKKKVGWQITLRGIQKRLLALREGEVRRPKSDTGPKLSAKDRRRLLMAATMGNEIVEAYDNGRDLKSAISEYKRIALDTEQLISILDIQNAESPDNTANARIAELSVEAFEILNGNFGDRLLGSVDGNRVMTIAKEVLRLKGARRRPRGANSNLKNESAVS